MPYETVRLPSPPSLPRFIPTCDSRLSGLMLPPCWPSCQSGDVKFSSQSLDSSRDEFPMRRSLIASVMVPVSDIPTLPNAKNSPAQLFPHSPLPNGSESGGGREIRFDKLSRIK